MLAAKSISLRAKVENPTNEWWENSRANEEKHIASSLVKRDRPCGRRKENL